MNVNASKDWVQQLYVQEITKKTPEPDFYNGLSVLPYNGGTYTQAPFEDCTKEDFERLVKTLSDVDLTKVIELQDNTDLRGEAACAGGACEIV